MQRIDGGHRMCVRSLGAKTRSQAGAVRRENDEKFLFFLLFTQ
jgi:hypothetical protein